jgi:hypothetical protein
LAHILKIIIINITTVSGHGGALFLGDRRLVDDENKSSSSAGGFSADAGNP